MAGEAEAGPVTLTGTGNMDDMNRAVDGSISRLFSMEGAVLAVGASLGFLASKAIAASVKAMASFETAMAGVQKVTGFADEKLQVVSEDVRDIAIRFGIAQEEVAEFAEAAARAGIRSEEEIAKFAETVAKMDIALDGLDGDQVADQFARLIGFLGVGADQADTVASTINDLANQMPTDAGRIIDSTSRMAADFRALGLNAPEILGLSAATSTLRESSNRAATRLRRVAQEMMSPSRLEEIAALFGTTGEKLSNLRNQAPIGLMLALAKVLNSNTEVGGRLADTLGVRVVSELRNVGLRSKRVTESLRIANEEWGKTQSINEEVAIFLDTINKKWDQFQSIIHDTAIEIGQFFKPAVLGLLGLLTTIAEDFRELNRATEGAFGAFILLTSAVFGAAIAVSSFATIFKVTFGESFKKTIGRVGRLAGRIFLLMGAVFTLAKAWEDNWLGIRDIVGSVVGFLSPIIDKAVKILRRFVGGAVDVFNRLNDATGGRLGKFLKFVAIVASIGIIISTVVIPAVSILASVIGGVIGGVSTAIGIFGALSGIISTVVGVIGTIVAILGGPLTLIILGVIALIAAFAADFMGIRTTVMEVVDDVVAFVRDNFVDPLKEIFHDVVDFIQRFLKADAKQKIFLAFFAIGRAIRILIDTYFGIRGKIADIIRGFVEFVVDYFKSGQAFRDIKSAFTTLIDVVLSVFRTGFEWGQKIGNIIRGFVTDFVEYIASGQAFRDLKSAFNTLIEMIMAAWRGFKKGLIGNSLIPETFTEAADWIKTTGKKLLKNAFETVVSTIENVLGNIDLSGVLGTLDSVISKAKDAINKVKGAASNDGSGGGGGGSGIDIQPGGFSSGGGAPVNIAGVSVSGLGDITGFQHGGLVTETGLALVHKGESVIPSAEGQRGTPAGGVNIERIIVEANSRKEGREAAKGFSNALSRELKSNTMFPNRGN